MAALPDVVHRRHLVRQPGWCVGRLSGQMRWHPAWVKPFLKGLGAVAVVAFLVVLSAGVVILLASMLRSATRWFFNGVNPTVTAAIVAGVATTVVSVLTVAERERLRRSGAPSHAPGGHRAPLPSDWLIWDSRIVNNSLTARH